MAATSTNIIKLLCLLLLLVASSSAKKKPKVKIDIESKPSDCTEVVETGDTVVVHYTGALEGGQIFDTSKREGREPFEVTIGQGRVIPGWEQGLLGMCSGEIRKLIIPPELAYGDRGIENVIPPKSTLFFHIELLQLKKKSAFSAGSIIPQGSGFYMLIGVIAIVGLVGYELYKKVSKQSEEAKKLKKSKKKGNKK